MILMDEYDDDDGDFVFVVEEEYNDDDYDY
jgi:hypothetical protein